MRLCSWWSAVLLVVVCAPPAPEINVSLQKNDTDRERVDRIHNVTLLDRNTTREVQGGSDPRLARLRETQDTDDRLRRSTNTSGTERRVGVTVSIGSRNESESQRRLRKSRGSVSLQETSKTFNYTFDKRKNPREAGGPPLGTTGPSAPGHCWSAAGADRDFQVSQQPQTAGTSDRLQTGATVQLFTSYGL
ncbi:hypothetical protein FJT64_002011 [Amphibalanus amphitrite]|uniref:Uncharacterized protein n=1 Tax=Amphibalanus amphitrite TaxID=1232801 RepID=A0A6A4WWS4_AMPAM|nr:hypothetical protein FJT64_002011 [Amphibalanus amphitrite]